MPFNIPLKEIALTYYESADGIIITRRRAIKELIAHGITDTTEFDQELGIHETYDAQLVLEWLGY